ncbi:MAG: DNA cytosine methyltransferase, partial [Terriglobia bacterium]
MPAPQCVGHSDRQGGAARSPRDSDFGNCSRSSKCQQISCVGKGEGIGTAECHTKRSGLWFEYLRIIQELRPRWVLIENVSRLLHKEDSAGIFPDMEGA